MTYDWEHKFIVVGVAMVNTEPVEGCFKLSTEEMEELSLMARVDVLKDILGDIQSIYDEALEDLADDAGMTF